MLVASTEGAMDDRRKRPRPVGQPAEEPATGESPGLAPGVRADPGREPGAATPAPAGEPVLEAAPRLEAELAELKDKYLRLAAEYDNFRKRSVKERTELWSKAQADLVQRLVDALDDLARFAHIEPRAETAKTIHEGVDLVERKIWKELEAAGVRRVDQVGVPFDPNLHEAVTTAPATAPEQDHTVGAVLQAGYQLAGALIRPARVVVLTWQPEATEGERD
jgi:molecular chaperone GrpE